ncbi:diguanylate cyclase [Lysobacter xanthus]
MGADTGNPDRKGGPRAYRSAQIRVTSARRLAHGLHKVPMRPTLPAMPLSNPSRRRRTALLALLVVAMVAIGGLMLRGIQAFDASALWVGHTHQVLGQIEAVRSALEGTESTARAFRLSNAEAIEADYQAMRPLALQRVDELTGLVADNPPQLDRARALAQLVKARLASIDATLDAHRKGFPDVANRIMLDSGMPQARRITEAADAMSAAERRLLAERQTARSRDARELGAAVAAGIVFSLSMLGLLLWLVARENRRSLQLEREAREALSTLESQTAQREQLAEQRRVLGSFAGLLHSCHTVGESLAITGNALAQLVPDGAGMCYAMRASQNLLEAHALFGTHGVEYPEVMRPDQCWALRRGHTHLYNPRRPTAMCEHLADLSAEHSCGACVPLTSQGTVLGLLHVSNRTGAPLSDLERAAVESIAEHLAVVLYSLELRESLRVQSLRDPLTGLHNRRYLEESLPREVERCERRGRPLSLLMLDVDHFKRFNDEHGHGAGDALLTRIGQVLAEVTRGEDIACRYGGEEFTIVMPEADLAQAIMRAEQIREAIAAAGITYMRRELGPVTVSIGVHQRRAGVDGPDALMTTADRALYAAKASGRNRVVAAGAGVGALPSP